MSGYAFECVRCRLTLDDGVDYTWCPKCGGTVTRTQVDRSPGPVGQPVSLAKTSQRVFAVFIIVQAVLALLAPNDFPYLAMGLVIAQVLAVALVALAIALVPELRALARDRKTRILHGLEHATINILLARGFPVMSGRTYTGEFTIRIRHEDKSWARMVEIGAAAREAITRVAYGEHDLAYSELCGTSWAVGYCLLALAIVGIGVAAAIFGAPTGYAFTATVAAAFTARAIKRSLGLWVQRHLSVSTDLLTATITAFEPMVAPDGNTFTVTIAMAVTPTPTRGGVIAV